MHKILIHILPGKRGGGDCLFVRATRYGMDGLEIVPRWRARDVPYQIRPPVKPT